MLNRIAGSFARSIVAVSAILLLTTVTALAHEYASGPLKVVHPWSPSTTPGATVGAGYMKVVNLSPAPIRLLGASSPAAARVEFHSMSMDGGVMRMRPLPEGLVVPANGQVQLKPGGMHMMLIGLNRPLTEEELVPLTLIFQGGLRMDVELYVENMGAAVNAHEH
ncbi:MAG: copper chaperone PCu(A)C [Alphaproteobacteria bacterium]|nr:copper chaperone PCu(A)C [Alphaproteobacteria bacterium]